MNNFYLTLPSNTTTHSDNSPAHFNVTIPRAITLVGKWEVALTEISFPYTWYNIDKTPEENDTVFFLKTSSSKKVPIEIPQGHYTDANILLEAFRRSVDNKKLQGHVKLNHDSVLNKFSLHIHNGSIISEIVLSKKLQYIMGFESNTISKTDGTIIAKYPPDFRGGVDQLYVYSNIVQPQIIGNSLGQVIRIVNVTNDNEKFGCIVERVYPTPHYVPIQLRKIDNISVSINTDQNVPVRFMYGKTLVKLHMRRVPINIFT
jgi:hypothetical protein